MKNKAYVEVAVALPIDNTYTYEIPDHLKAGALPGMRVLVPFGRRRVTAYILAEIPDSRGYKAKKIIDLLDDGPLFPASMIPFFRWISRYYLHPPGEVIKAALPVGLNSYDVSMLSALKKGITAWQQGSLTPGESRIMALLPEGSEVPSKTITRQPGLSGSHALIKKMALNGLIEVTSKLKKDQTRMKMEKFLCFPPLSPPEHGLSAKRREILKTLHRHKEISLRVLRKEIPSAPRLIKFLKESGHIEVFEKQVFRDPFGEAVDPDVPPRLTDEQEGVVSEVKEHFNLGFKRYLLSGVTGSGKTEVYMRLVSEAVERNMGAIVLVPEISLISQTERRFRARFGDKIAVIHSGLSSGEKLDQWKRIMNREVSIVIGARSAIFAPLDNPGIIIVDEEHDTSYKQESTLRYNARDMAVVRAKFNNISVILGSATPSVQTCYNACQGRFQELQLKQRVNKKPLPEITLVDLKKYKDFRGMDRIITPELSREIGACLARGNQALIFLNRRGFATFPVCKSCGETIKCRFCDITMTLHKAADQLLCHLCGYAAPSNMKCPKCGNCGIQHLGFGTEKIEAMLKTMFPHARVARLDQDTGGKKGATVQILKKVKNHTVDIIVGTQMLAKGHDFPSITLVGVICADMSLNFPDFRSGERTFQILAQVAGRAGRGDQPGKVIMQTYNPDHFSIEASRNQDFMEFYNKEIPFRKALSYPPFARIIQLKISGKDMEKVKSHAMMTGEICKGLIDTHKETAHLVQMLGPIEAGIPKISMRYRWQVLLKSPSAALLNMMVQDMKKDKRTFQNRDVKVSIDVDPYFMM